MKTVVKTLSNEEKGTILLTQFHAAEEGRKQIIIFGLMLEELATSFRPENGAKTTDEGYNSGLKGWLSEFAPDVNYNTAMSYRRFAVNARALWLEDNAKTPAELAAPEDYAQDVFDFVKNIPLQDLKGKAGRKSLAAGGTAPEPRKRLTADDRIAMAEADLADLVKAVNAFLNNGKEKLVMDAPLRTHARTAFEGLIKALK